MDYKTTVTHDTDYELDAAWDLYWREVGEQQWRDARALNETIESYGVTLSDVQGSSQGYSLGSRTFDLDNENPEAMRDRLDGLLASLCCEFPVYLLAEDPLASLLSSLDASDITTYRVSLDTAAKAYDVAWEADQTDADYDGPDWDGLVDYDAQRRLESQLDRGLVGWMNDLQYRIDVLSPDATHEFWHDLAVERLTDDGLDKESAEAAFTDWSGRH